MENDLQQTELKDKIREWWNDPSQDYDGFHGHGVNYITALCRRV